MRKIAMASTIMAASMALAGVAHAQNEMPDGAKADPKATVVDKGAITDGCINPREAGLKFGNRALDYWPGKPASEK